MIKNVFTILFFLVFCNGLSHAGQKVMFVQSSRIAPYEEAIKGFESVCHCETIQFVISESKGADIIKKIDHTRPDLILAVGMDALANVKTITDIPVIYCMVLNPGELPAKSKNISGISMNVSPEVQLNILSKMMPGLRTVSLIYDPGRTGAFVKNAQKAAVRSGIQLIAKQVHHPKSVAPLINKMGKDTDIFWMLPDITVINPDTIKFLLLFSIRNKIPILTFSEKYLALGTFMSISINAYDIGIQAGEMAGTLLSGETLANNPHIDARKADIRINHKVAAKLGIHIDEKIIREIRTDD